MKDDLQTFFQHLLELSQPRATLFVTEETRRELREEDKDAKELPTSFSKRGLYAGFCNEQGWRLETSPRGVMILKEDDTFKQ